MSIRKLIFGSALLLLMVFSAFGVELTEAERHYVNQIGPVDFCVDPDWAPFEVVDETGRHVGIAADLLALVAQRTGLSLRLISTRDWPESMAASQAGRCKVMSLLNQTPARDAWLIFTQPILTDANIIVTREEHPFIVDLKGLSDHTMVLPKGTSIEERVRRDFPNIRVVIVDTEAQALQQVSERQADMTLRSLIVAAHTIKREGWFNLKIAGQVPGYGNQLRVGVSHGDVMLRDILDKGVASITAIERQKIIDDHIAITVTTGIDYSLLQSVVAIFSLVLLTSLYWLRKLSRLNKALHKSEDSVQQFQKIAGLGTFVLNIQSGAWTRSEVCGDLFGLSAADPCSAEAWTARIHPDDRIAMVKIFTDTVTGQNRALEQTYRIIRQNDQAERWIHVLGQLTFDGQGRPLKLLGTVQDITARKQAELQMQLAKEMAEQTAAQQRQFIAMLSHEVRTPLAVIDATAQLLDLRLQGDPAQLPLLGRIRRGAARLSNFFTNCLTNERIDSPNFTVQPCPVALAPLVMWAKETAEILSEQHTCQVDIEPDLPSLLGDQVLLRILLMNLLTNALKYAPENKAVVVRVGRQTHNAQTCRIAVEDQGPGIALDELNTIFHKYQRGRAAQTTPGAGLGLALVARIAELHGGTVCAESAPGQGTRFVVDLPFASPH